MLRAVFCFLLTLPFAAASQTINRIDVHIEVIADSGNQIAATVQVEPNTNGRDLMERLFKMEYRDFTRRFVVTIAGFRAEPKEKKFWKLEIDGTASQVGIAEVMIKNSARIRWRLAEF